MPRHIAVGVEAALLLIWLDTALSLPNVLPPPWACNGCDIASAAHPLCQWGVTHLLPLDKWAPPGQQAALRHCMPGHKTQSTSLCAAHP